VFVIAALGAVFAGAALFGWRSLPPAHPRRRLWQGSAVVIAAVIVATSAVWQAPRYRKTFTSSKPADNSLDAQQRIADDLRALVSSRALTTACLPISVPYATPVPLLALELHTSPANIVFRQIRSGTYLETATAAVYQQYQLDPQELQRHGRVRPGFHQSARNRSWITYKSCR
jgi:hypothetical protein